jgi:alpha-mannosidase II
MDFKSTDLAETPENMIKIESNNMHLLFSPKNGFLNKIVTDAKEIQSKIKFIKYGTTSASEKSGAYLFLPDGPGVELRSKKLLQWIRVEHSGKLRNRVCANLTLLLHCVDVYPSIDRIKNLKYPVMHIWNMVDLRHSHNFELAMHIETDIKNDQYVYTDLNGFQYIKRKHYNKLTIQGNVYPMPSGAFIQDTTKRLNLLTGQPLGVASLDPSSLQVFLDRRLDQDDNRGMEQAMNDNVLVSSRLLVFFESINGMTSSIDKSESLASNHPSLMSQLLSFDLINSITKMVLVGPNRAFKSELILSNKKKKYPCDLRLINLRTMQTQDEKPMQGDVGLIFHRVPYEDCPAAPFAQLSSYYISQCGSDDINQFSFDDFFEFFSRNDTHSVKVNNIANTYLTLQKKNSVSKSKFNSESIFNHLQPMQIEAFRVDLN